MDLTRFTRNASAAVVAGIAGYASFWHQVAVALAAGERSEIAHVIPLSVDGMLVVASVVMVDDRQRGLAPRWSARIAFAIGTTATIAANIAGAHPTLLGRAVAAWPALALLLVVEMLSRKGKAQLEAERSARVPVSPGMPPLEVEQPEHLAFRAAQAELRRTSALAALDRGGSTE